MRYHYGFKRNSAHLLETICEAMIHVTSTVRNAWRFVGPCIDSVVRQSNANWRLHIFDAASTDDTDDAIREAIWRANADYRILPTFEYAPTGIFDKLLPLWRSFDDDDIIVWLDGDDQLATPHALETVAAYHEAGALVTYGQFIWNDGSIGFAGPVGPDPRSEPWRATHLKTFRAGLVKKIKDEDLRDSDGEYFKYVTDQCVMLPLLEMAPERSVFIPKVLHIYSGGRGTTSPSDMEKEMSALRLIRSRPRYGRVE